MFLHCQKDLDDACQWLASTDRRMAQLVAEHGLPRLRRMPPGLASLLRIVTDQLISLKAGEAIWSRIQQAIDPGNSAAILRLGVDDLKGYGLSTAKARTFLAAASACQTGLDFEQLGGRSDDDVLTQLTAISGIGPWTADIYLLFAMGRQDAWPKGDLALQVAAQDIMGLSSRPAPGHMISLAETWRPHRGAAAHLLWSHYRRLRGLPQA